MTIYKDERQQIERYAMDIAFWKNEMITITPDSSDKTIAHSFMATYAHTELIKNHETCRTNIRILYISTRTVCYN